MTFCQDAFLSTPNMPFFRGEEISRGEEIPRQKWYEETERLYSLLRRELQLDA